MALTSRAQAGVGLAGPADQQLGGLVAAVGATAEVVLDQGVAEQPGLDGLGVAVQAAAGGQDHASRDIAGVAAVRPAWQSRKSARAWLRGPCPRGARELQRAA